jgi:hypothetical protein
MSAPIFEDQSQFAQWRNQHDTKMFFEAIKAHRRLLAERMLKGEFIRENREETGVAYAIEVARAEIFLMIDAMDFESYQLLLKAQDEVLTGE